MTQLSDTQAIILSAAAQRTERIALPLPESLRGGAAAKVVSTMIAKGLLQVSASGTAYVAQTPTRRRNSSSNGHAGQASKQHRETAAGTAATRQPQPRSAAGVGCGWCRVFLTMLLMLALASWILQTLCSC